MAGERVVVDAADAGERLDRWLAARVGLPRNQVRRWIEEGRVHADGERCKASHRLAAGEGIGWEAPPSPGGDPRIVPERGELRLLWEDDEVLVVDKPAGLTVHPGAGRSTGTLAHRLLDRFPELAGVGGPGRPGIVHRLDRDTSGALVVARTPAAYRRLQHAFAAREVEKRYLAIGHGVLADARDVDAPIGRHPLRRQEMAVRPQGRPASSRFVPLASVAAASLLGVDLHTGRTHQIRVHAKSIGHPLVGDPLYGEARWKGARGPARELLRDFPRPALHAWRIAFRHPASGEALRVEAPPPEDLRGLWRGLSGHEIEEALPATGR
jgi:23S rRNA pseudouridine1911/1915/1917 synthase